MRAFFFGAALLAALPAQAEIYKCVGADGKINFTDSPCSANASSEIVELPPVPETPYQRRMRELEEGRKEHEAAMAELEAESAKRRVQREEERRLLWHKYYARQQGTGLIIGMTSKEVEALPNWGVPDDVNATTTAAGTREQWIYSVDDEAGRVYLYFDGGRLVAIQN